MPARRRVSAPANRIYKSPTPLKQTKLTAPKLRIKPYGKKPSVRLPKQETLTQMDFLKVQQLQHEDDEEDDQKYEEEPKKRKQQRRKTTGDAPSMSRQFYTQTITQLEWSFTSVLEEEDRSISDVPSSSQSARLPMNARKRPANAESAIPPPPHKSPKLDMPPPRTPHRMLVREIPSSQSPATPESTHSRNSVTRLSPLKDSPIKTLVPFNTNAKPQGRPFKQPELCFEETCDIGPHASQLSPVLSTPSAWSSPAKSVRFAIPEMEEDDATATPSIELDSTPYFVSEASSETNSSMEILDSDAESEDEGRSEPPASTAQSGEEYIGQEAGENTELPDSNIQEDKYQQAETESCYGEIGAETQMEAEKILDSPRLSGITPGRQSKRNPSADTSQESTQIMDSQRLATQYMDMMPPRTANSDIFISIHPQHVTNIINRTKDHEMRTWTIPPTVCRVWIYETKPVSALKYMVEISPAKRPGQILDERGIGNAEFNMKRGSHWTAYEILQLYELSDPLPLSQLIANEWLKSAPQRFAWVRPAVVDQLMANLKPPLFHNAELDTPVCSSTDTQEAEAQLLSTIQQFTQPPISSQRPSSQFIKPENKNNEPAPSDYASPHTEIKPAPPDSQATTVDLSQTQTPRHHAINEVVWESPTRPVPSSTPLNLPTPLSAGSEYNGTDSLVPYSIASSQLLTKSQLLPENLMNESVPGPPPFIQDSDDEEEL